MAPIEPVPFLPDVPATMMLCAGARPSLGMSATAGRVSPWPSTPMDSGNPPLPSRSTERPTDAQSPTDIWTLPKATRVFMSRPLGEAGDCEISRPDELTRGL